MHLERRVLLTALAVFGLTSAVWFGRSATADEPTKPKMLADSPIAERNIKNFLQYQEAGVKRDFTHLDDLVAPTLLIRSGGPDSLQRLLSGQEPQRPQTLEREDIRKRPDSFANLEGHKRVMQEIYGIGDMVIARWRIQGLMKGKLFGLEGSNRPIDLTEVAFVRFDKDGRMIEGWYLGDTTELLQQLGYKVTAPSTP